MLPASEEIALYTILESIFIDALKQKRSAPLF